MAGRPKGEKRSGKRMKAAWTFETLAEAERFMESPPGPKFRVWLVTDPARPGRSLFVVDRNPLGAVGRAADKWGFRCTPAKHAPTLDEVIAQIRQMTPEQAAEVQAALKRVK